MNANLNQQGTLPIEPHRNPDSLTLERGPESRFAFDGEAQEVAKIAVVGVGGGGGNAINNMVMQGINGVDFVAINTDSQALKGNLAFHKIQAGRNMTKGLGTGARPSVGAEALQQDRDVVESVLDGFDMAFITAGMGGGTGTGGAPVVANVARSLGILTVGIVTKPFECEGRHRMKMAVEGINRLREYVDTLIVIPNERLLDISDDNTSLIEAFQRADDVLHNATRGIADLITVNGLINLDFADVRTTMQEGGTALMGAATASGDERAKKAAMEAISSPLLDGLAIDGARNVLVNITAGTSLGIREATSATGIIQKEAGENVEVIFGTVIDESMGENLRVTVIATGFDREHDVRAARRTVPLQKAVYDYKGEHSLKELDIPAYERRGQARPGDAQEQEGPRGTATEPSRSRSRDAHDTPAFLRRMMD